MAYNIRDGRLQGVKKSVKYILQLKKTNSDIEEDVMLIHYCKHLSEISTLGSYPNAQTFGLAFACRHERSFLLLRKLA